MTYAFGYAAGTPYEHAVGLVTSHAAHRGGVVVDLGCGYGAIAEPLGERSFAYLGVDLDPGGVKSIVERGFEALVGDLGRIADVLAEVEEALAGRPLAAVCMLDVVEHMADHHGVLEAVRQFAGRAGPAPLVVSIPNVTHVDMGVKVLMGRWDVTRTGLLDSTHLRFFSAGELDRTMARTGWREVGRHDFELPYSDQHFPHDLVTLERETPVGAFLVRLRQMAGPDALVNQYVRAYEPATARPVETRRDETPGVFLSVLVRTQGTRPVTLQETLLSLAAQTCDDFEVLLLAHDVDAEVHGMVQAMVDQFHVSFARRVRVVAVEGGGRAYPLNIGADLARGRYLAMLDDDDLAFGHWVAELRAAAERRPGRVLRVGVATQEVEGGSERWSREDGYQVVGKPRAQYPLDFDFLTHFFENATPNCGYAVPRSLVVDLGQHWDESLPVLEDWDFLLRTASISGVESAATYGTLVRQWTNAENSLTRHTAEEWAATRARVVAGIDAHPMLLDGGSMSRLRAVFHQVHLLELEVHNVHERLGDSYRDLEAARHHLEDIYRSRSWRVARLLARAGEVARAALRPARGRRVS